MLTLEEQVSHEAILFIVSLAARNFNERFRNMTRSTFC